MGSFVRARRILPPAAALLVVLGVGFGPLAGLGAARSKTQVKARASDPCAGPLLEPIATIPAPARPVPGSFAGPSAPFALFRRSPTSADALPGVGPDVAGELTTYDPRAVRLISGTGANRLFLVGGRQTSRPIPRACSRQPGIGALLRSGDRGGPGVCPVIAGQPTDTIGGLGELPSGACITVADVPTGYGFVSQLSQRGRSIGLVPDGVASVDVRFVGGPAPRVTVNANVYAFHDPVSSRSLDAFRRVFTSAIAHPTVARLERALGVPAQIVWRDAAGRVLKVFSPPPLLARILHDEVRLFRSLHAGGHLVGVRGSPLSAAWRRRSSPSPPRRPRP